MLSLRDERRVIIDEPKDIDLFRRVETPIMDIPSHRNKRLHIPVSKSFDFARFISKELQGILADDNNCSDLFPADQLSWPASNACDQIVSESEDEGPPLLMPFTGFTSPKDCPATRALDLASKLEQAKKAGIYVADFPPKKMIHRKSLKRGRSSLASFDVSELIEAAQPVEDSISFPSIEWNFDEGDGGDDEAGRAPTNTVSPFPDLENDNDGNVMLEQPKAKRLCRGLVRSHQVACDLSQLEGIQ